MYINKTSINASPPRVPSTPASPISSMENIKIPYSAPGSPIQSDVTQTANNSSDIILEIMPINSPPSALETPQQIIHHASLLFSVQKKLSRQIPLSSDVLKLVHLDSELYPVVDVIKDRYIIFPKSEHHKTASSADTQLLDMNMSMLKCIDVFTGEQFLCKIINEPLYKVQRAYINIQQESNQCRSSIYGHQLIRNVKDIVSYNNERTYVILAPPKPLDKFDSTAGVFEDLHTYLRDKQRLEEAEARTLFHQICETVLICHRNGIILRDLKLKRFFFVDEARTKIQYESLEGCMILNNPNNDTLSDKIGCPLYTAPELLCPALTYRGKPADMWALGVILYTMLVGQYPFFEKPNTKLVTIIRQCFVQMPSSLSRPARWLLLSLLRRNFLERLTIEQIFLTPWLAAQKPFHLYIPVNVSIPDDNDNEQEFFERRDYTESKNVVNAKAEEQEEDDESVQSLDYSSSMIMEYFTEMG